MEPSAGTGALCAFALAAGATVHANELSDRRADLLAVLLGEAGQDPAQTLTRENADHLDAILPPSVRSDVVLIDLLRGKPEPQIRRSYQDFKPPDLRNQRNIEGAVAPRNPGPALPLSRNRSNEPA